jgi:DNA polymerase-3 subunit delta'
MPFRDIVGHGQMRTLLARAVQQGTLPPTLLFAGPNGVGKRMTAVALAQALNCLAPLDSGHADTRVDGSAPLTVDPERSRRGEALNPESRIPFDSSDGPPSGSRQARSWQAADDSNALSPSTIARGSLSVVEGSERSESKGESGFSFPDACGRCTACTRIARGVHADVRLLTPNERGAIAVDAVRDVIDQANYRPFEGRRRVIIVDDADETTEAAQNALLKTLEEPTPSSVFVLVTARPDLLRPTVRSRCQRLRFGLIDAEEIANGLTTRHGFTVARARAAAAMAGGCFARALADEGDEATEARSVAADVLRGLARTPAPRLRLELAQRLMAAAERKGRGASRGTRARGSGAATERELLGRRLEALSVLLRDVGATVSNAVPQRLANADMHPLLTEAARGFDVGRLVRAYRTIDQGLVALDRNISPKTVADWVVMQL